MGEKHSSIFSSLGTRVPDHLHLNKPRTCMNTCSKMQTNILRWQKSQRPLPKGWLKIADARMR